MKLSDVCTKGTSNIAQKDLDARNGDYPIYGASGFIKNVDFYHQENPYIAIVKDGAGVGRVMQLPAKSSVIGTMQYIIPNEGVSVEYLAYALEHMNLSKYCLGAAIPHIYFKDYCSEPFPNHTSEEQANISHILGLVSNLIFLRKQQLSKLDELVKSRFIELFGDPAGNPMGWPTETMKNASIRLSDGPFGSNLKSSHYTAEGVRVIRLGNIGCGCFNDADKSFVPQEHYEKLKKYTCRAGEIVIATLGDPNLRACIIPDYIGLGINKSDCVHYIPKPNLLNNQFVCQYINCPETLVLASGMVHGQTRSRISSGQLADLPIFLPPIELQNQFAAFVEQTDKSKLAVQNSIAKLEELKKSLMQKYFG